MRGPVFRQLIETRSYKIDPDESLDDLEKMYTLLIESRGKNLNNLTRMDETIALITLCQISYPSKTPKFLNGSKQLRADFKGISRDIILERRFQNKIRNAFKNALNENQLNLDDIGNLFFD